MEINREIADEILRRLAEGETLRGICREDGFPSYRTIGNWRKKDEAFDAEYQEAMLTGCHVLLDETLAIADDTANDYVEGPNGPAYNPEAVQRSKLRIWTRHELVKRKRPDVFSDKVAMQHSGAIATTELTHEQWLASLE